MVNTLLIESLLCFLPQGYKQKVQSMLMGDPSQSLFYLCARRDFPLPVIELLADVYGVSLGNFCKDRVDSGGGMSQSTNIVHGSNNLVANVGLCQDVEMERLRQQLRDARDLLAAKDELIAAKEEIIASRNRELEWKNRLLDKLMGKASQEDILNLFSFKEK